MRCGTDDDAQYKWMIFSVSTIEFFEFPRLMRTCSDPLCPLWEHLLSLLIHVPPLIFQLSVLMDSIKMHHLLT